MSKKKSKRVLTWIDTGIFPATVLFTCGYKYDEIVKTLKKEDAQDWVEGISGCKELIDDGHWFGLKRTFTNIETKEVQYFFYIILINKFDFSDDHYCKLAHECLHICQFLLPEILDRDREIEAEAYLHTHLMRQCLEAIRA